MKKITSPDNDEIKEARKLHDTKHRKETGLFFFEGVHLTEEYFKSGKTPFRVFIREDAVHLYPADLDSEYVRIITTRLYDKITAESAPQGIFVIGREIDLSIVKIDEADLCNLIPQGAVVLESMRDPGNVGTVIRTAAAFDIQTVFTADSADVLSPKVIRASMGAVFFARVYIIESACRFAWEAAQKNIPVYAAALDRNAVKIGNFRAEDNSVFIIGNEGQGLKKETIDACFKKAFIPMKGKTESLNAAIAASIIIWEKYGGRVN